jgi:hypothetical protein
MKYFLRRLGFALCIAPITVALYLIGYGLLSLVVDQPLFPPADILWLVGVMSGLFILFAKQINKVVSWMTD